MQVITPMNSFSDRRRGNGNRGGHRKNRGGRMNGMPLLPSPPQSLPPQGGPLGIVTRGPFRPGRGMRFQPPGPPASARGGFLGPPRLMGPGPRGPPMSGIRRMPPTAVMGSGPPQVYGVHPLFNSQIMMRPPFNSPLHPPNGFPSNKAPGRGYPNPPSRGGGGVIRRGRFHKKSHLNMKKIDLTKPWITEAIKTEFKKKDELLAVAKSTQSEDDWRKYREQREICNKVYADGEKQQQHSTNGSDEAKSSSEINKFDDRELNDSDSKSTKVQEVHSA